jgi:hypothetical protein
MNTFNLRSFPRVADVAGIFRLSRIRTPVRRQVATFVGAANS